MDKLSDILFLAAQTAIYIAAVTTALTGYGGLNETYNLMKDNLGYEYILYEQNHTPYEIPQKLIYTHLQLKALLISGVDMDIKIDDTIILASEFNKYSFDFMFIGEFSYKKDYIYKNNGNIELILFTRIQENEAYEVYESDEEFNHYEGGL